MHVAVGGQRYGEHRDKGCADDQNADGCRPAGEECGDSGSSGEEHDRRHDPARTRRASINDEDAETRDHLSSMDIVLPLEIVYARNLFRPADFGGNRYPWEITRRLAARGHRVRVVTPRPEGSLPGPTDVTLIQYPVSRRTPLETFATNAIGGRIALERSLRGEPADVVVVGSYDVAFGYFLARARRSAKTVFTYHSAFRSDAVQRVITARSPRRVLAPVLTAFVTFVERLCYRSADLVIAVSPFSKTEVEEKLGRTSDRVVVIPTGVDTTVFKPGDRCAARQHLGLPEESFVLAGVGRMTEVKRYDRAIRVIAMLRSEGLDAMLLLVGRGPAEPGLRALATELGLGDAVRFEGFQDGEELVTRFQSADMQICTSEFENWSLAILEGMACGLPCVGVPRGGIPQLISLVDEGLVTPSTEIDAIADTVRRWSADRQRLDAASARAATIAAEQFDWERIVDRLEAALGRLARS